MRINVRKSKYGFSTSYVAKKENEQDEFGYIDVGFKKDQEPKIEDGDTARISVKDGFFSGYKSKDGVKPKFIVMNYELLETKKAKQEQVEKSGLEPIETESLPF